jgi:predicted metal-dependent hydrolase
MTDAKTQTIELNGQTVEYRLIRSKSALKLRVRVGLHGVAVVLPPARDPSEVPEFLQGNAAWIKGQTARVEALKRVRRPDVVARGELLYRGQSTPVRVEESAARRGAARVTQDASGIVILRSVHSATPPHVTLENWLRKQARAAIETELAPLLAKLDAAPHRVYLMEQRTKWGNCSARGNLSFNWRLILAPPHVLRYLVTHEAVHLAVPDHSKRFWLTVQSLCPETERARQWLCANGFRLLTDLKTLCEQQNEKP